MRDLLSDYVLGLVLDYGGMPVETPVMYDLDNPAINEHAGKFGNASTDSNQATVT